MMRKNPKCVCVYVLQFTFFKYFSNILPHIQTRELVSPPSTQEEQAQRHVVSHVEAVDHLATGSLVQEATELEHLQVS